VLGGHPAHQSDAVRPVGVEPTTLGLEIGPDLPVPCRSRGASRATQGSPKPASPQFGRAGGRPITVFITPPRGPAPAKLWPAARLLAPPPSGVACPEPPGVRQCHPLVWTPTIRHGAPRAPRSAADACGHRRPDVVALTALPLHFCFRCDVFAREALPASRLSQSLKFE
jgi:hypothetical protein